MKRIVPDLSGGRPPRSRLRLPADERRPWQKPWADMNELLGKAGGDHSLMSVDVQAGTKTARFSGVFAVRLPDLKVKTH